MGEGALCEQGIGGGGEEHWQIAPIGADVIPGVVASRSTKPLLQADSRPVLPARQRGRTYHPFITGPRQ